MLNISVHSNLKQNNKMSIVKNFSNAQLGHRWIFMCGAWASHKGVTYLCHMVQTSGGGGGGCCDCCD